MSHHEHLVHGDGNQQSISYQHLSLEDSPQNRKFGFASPRESTNHSSKLTSFVSLSSLEHRVDNIAIRHRKLNLLRYEFIRTWWSELLSCLLFIGALIAIVVTVLPYTDEPLPQWRYGLSINTLVAIYAVILKSTVLYVTAEGLSQLKWAWYTEHHPLKDILTFDEASRGPWGALSLIWKIRGHHFVIYCGAFITVATLIVDPFAQQIISTYNCSISSSSEQAMICRTNSFNERRNESEHIPSASIGIQKAINSGIFSPGSTVAFDCPTSNCTFTQDYHTVAYCSKCKDTTSNLFFHEKSFSDESDYFFSDIESDSSLSDYSLSDYVLSWVPGDDYNSGLLYGEVNLDDSEIFVMRTTYEGSTDMVAKRLPTNHTRTCSAECSTVEDILNRYCKTKHGEIGWGCFGHGVEKTDYGYFDGGMGAASCSLFPCIRTYTAEVKNGLLRETILSATNFEGRAMVNIECLNAHDRKLLINDGYDIRGKSWLPYNKTVDTFYDEQDMEIIAERRKDMVSHECIYQYSETPVISVGNYLGSFLAGAVYNDSKALFQGPAQVQTIYDEVNLTLDRINETWRNLSDSMTTYVRQHGDELFSAPAIGVAYQAQACVRIRWAFLIYPAILVFLCLIFFVSMVLKTRDSKTSRHDWKSSPLALIFHGLEREAIINRNEVAESIGAKEMEMIAERTSVRLSKTENGWNFTKK